MRQAFDFLTHIVLQIRYVTKYLRIAAKVYIIHTSLGLIIQPTYNIVGVFRSLQDLFSYDMWQLNAP
jgi:hypothetical protein